MFTAIWFPHNEDNGVDATVTVYEIGYEEPVTIVLGVDELEDATEGLADEGWQVLESWTESPEGVWWEARVSKS